MSQGSLAINSVTFTGFVVMDDLSPLWGFPTLAGSNVRIPQGVGRVAFRRYVDETTYQLPMRISHDRDHSGSTITQPDGLRQNLDYLWTNVFSPTIGTTVSSTLTLPNAATRTAAVQPQLSDPGRAGEHLGFKFTRFVLYLTVPAGVYA